MKVTVSGNLAQVKAVLNPVPVNRKARKGEGRNAVIREQHAILRRAFEIVRRDPEQTQLADALLAALVGRAERTKDILDTAKRLTATTDASTKGGGMADETRWHRFRHYPDRYSNFDQIEKCNKPKFCCGCEFKHPLCTEGGVVQDATAISTPVRSS